MPSLWISWLVSLTLALVFARAVWADAKDRDFDAWMWAAGIVIVGTLVPILGTFLVVTLYLMVRPRGAKRRCVACGRRVLVHLVVCPHCHAPTKRDCPRCHEAIPVDADSCPHCAARAS